ncbi:unnamed protein product, partial [marine sediment metagenome]
MQYQKVLHELYNSKGVLGSLTMEYDSYLKDAIKRIDNFWFENIKLIEKVELVILAEAPMWGDKESYIYNPDANETDFFKCEHLNSKYSSEYSGKTELITALIDKGIVFLDVSPFPLNPKKTAICYRKRRKSKSNSKKIGVKDYKKIMKDTFNSHTLPKLKEIYKKNDSEIPKYAYRYKTVMDKHETLFN